MAAGAFGGGGSSSWHTLLVLGFLPLPFVPAAEAPPAGAIDERSRCRRPLEDVEAAGGAVTGEGRRPAALSQTHRGGEGRRPAAQVTQVVRSPLTPVGFRGWAG
jgi:hypothetical protein